MIVDNNNFKSEVEDSKGFVFVDFYADWCGPCKMMSPIVDELSKETDVKVVKINVDDSPEIAQKYGIIPTQGSNPSLLCADALPSEPGHC